VVVEENDRPVASVELMRKALTKGVNKFCVHDRGTTGYLGDRIP
jgi:hypothetical protein